LSFKSAANDLCAVFPAYHAKGGLIPSAIDKSLIVIRNSDIFDDMINNKDNCGFVMPGNCDLSFLAICRQIPNYYAYIRVEYDVLAIADPHHALKRISFVGS
jgi:hypothetical protein